MNLPDSDLAMVRMLLAQYPSGLAVFARVEALNRAYLEAVETLRRTRDALINATAWCDGPLEAHQEARAHGAKALEKARVLLVSHEKGQT